jgi:hypothetical protein
MRDHSLEASAFTKSVGGFWVRMRDHSFNASAITFCEYGRGFGLISKLETQQQRSLKWIEIVI